MFCSPCDLWEKERKVVNKNAKRDSSRYQCKKWHTNGLCPIKLKEEYIPSRVVWTTPPTYADKFPSDTPIDEDPFVNDEDIFFPDDLSEINDEDLLTMYLAEVERIINRTILGDDNHPGPFRLSYDHKDEKLAPISMENYKIRQVVNGLESLIEVSYVSPIKKLQMTRSIPKYPNPLYRCSNNL